MNPEHLKFCGSDEWRETVREQLLPWALGDVDLGPELLEVGPGLGATTEVLRTHVERLTAVEIHPELAARLAERFAGTNVEVVPGDATALTFDDDTFSGATSFTMLHHVPTAELQDRLFAEVARVVRPGGVFVAGDSVASDELRSFHHDDVYNPVDPDALADRMAAAGFVDVDIRVADARRWSARARVAPPGP